MPMLSQSTGPTRYLVIAPNWIGDLAMAGSMLRYLHQDPANHVTVLANAWNHALLSRFPDVDQVIPVDWPHGQWRGAERRMLGRQWRGAFDVAIVLPHSWKSALFPWWAQVPIRRGWLGEYRWGLLNQIWYRPQRITRLVDRYLRLAVPDPQSPLPVAEPARLVPDPDSRAQWRQRLGWDDLPEDPPRTGGLLALCPGAAFGVAKRWPARYYQQLAADHVAQGGRVCIFGSAQERAWCEQVIPPGQDWSAGERPAAVQCLAGVASLAETVDLLSCAHAVISNDSGLLHVAAALGKPTVGIYGSTSPAYTPPFGPRVRTVQHPVPCQPCFKRTCPLGHMACLEQLQPEQVQAAWEQLRSESANSTEYHLG